ncbi:hypothetical protein K503DRAFT_786239 [Rhizopogon vinicolor AM-OR11-026]|uniref:Uncharacterized protein n=1 Tax=Rhizopogon vinicolor AM-OR11-026 TaxID=1314800 RepID=A0A1B7MMJ9_9AGAM|nr:hypothetical protein K503DRAFT_786239 [Rhizopogon vinicolor AM-OR11-026]
MYDNFWADTFRTFFDQWPERNCTDNSIPAEGDLTDSHLKGLKAAIQARKIKIKRWYRWQTNTARLMRSGGLSGAHKTLSRGVDVIGWAPQEVEVYSQVFYNERVKADADAAIKDGNIISRGKKLSKRRDVTRAKYAAEDASTKANIKEMHKQALIKWHERRELAKSGVIGDVDQDSKIRSLAGPSVNLGHILITFSDAYPTTLVVLSSLALLEDATQAQENFHLGETEMGEEFSAHHAGFADVQVAYANFIKEALVHNDALQALAEVDTAADRTYDADQYLDSNCGGDLEGDLDNFLECGGAGEEEQEDNIDAEDVGNIERLINGHYQFKDEGSIGKLAPVGPATASVAVLQVPEQPLTYVDLDPLPFDEFDFSSLDMDDINEMLATLPPFDPHTMTSSCTPSTDPDFGLLHHGVSNFSSSSFLPVTGVAFPPMLDYSYDNFYNDCALTGPLLPLFPDDTSALCISSPSHSTVTPTGVAPPCTGDSSSPPTVAFTSQNCGAGEASHYVASAFRTTGATGTDESPVPPASQTIGPQESSDAPRRTTRRHVPSMREQVLNAIGSSNARVCPGPPVAAGKENNKWKADTTATTRKSTK